jgi:hypothetical protein
MSELLWVAVGIVVLAVLFGGGSGRLRIGRVVEDFEARLRPLQQEGPTWMAFGKAHRERYANGREEFDLRCRGIRTNTGEPRIPSGAAIEVLLGETVIATAPLRQGHLRLILSNRKRQEVPKVQEGTVVSVRYQGTILLRGVFALD